MNFIQDSCQRFSLHFKSTFHWLLQVYCITQKIYICQELQSSHQKCSIKKGFLRNFTKFTGKHLPQNLFFNKACNFIKKGTLAQVFSCGFCKISKSTFLQKASGRLLLELTLQCHETWLSCTFSSKPLYALELIRVQIFRLATARMKINQILTAFFKPPVHFSLNIAAPLVSWHIVPLKFSS